MSIRRSILFKDFAPLSEQGIFNATLNARGLYNTFQFVLRLSPAVHERLSSLPSSLVTRRDISFADLEAFSTYLHETVHWWQHIGSTYGFTMSLAYPAQAYANHSYLKKIIHSVGFRKSIRQLSERMPQGGFGTPSGYINIVLNNHYDMHAYRCLTVSPVSARRICENQLFESVGNSFHITLGNIVSLIASVSDREFETIPHPKHWQEPLQKLRDAREEGHYFGSPIGIYPVGAYEIFEGQARVTQLQYLYFSTSGEFDVEVARNTSMFEGVYGKALSVFYDLTGLEPAPSIDHPTIALFLVICDVAINPGSGFPFPMVNFGTLIHDLDPGARFTNLCRLARIKCPEVLDCISEYSRDEYEFVTSRLCDALVEPSPLAVAQEFRRWMKVPSFKSIMDEHETYKYSYENIVVRVLFSHFLDFMKDKSEMPEVFCWPGAWMAGTRVSEKVKTLFDRHGALFVDKPDDDGVFPRMRSDRSETSIQDMFEHFYANNVVFNLTNQWIAVPGEFEFDFRWLSSQGSKQDIQAFSERCFRSAYGVSPSEAEIL